jgi:2-polyprenyl-6-hydroxyphenyl methylase/3-demethylubiquinone-9 3-methyltransferase
MQQVVQMPRITNDLRFEFGKNWRRFLHRIDETRMEAARRSLSEKLKMTNLEGLSFVDIGCGSGLFSLAARQLGATVLSFDFDPDSVSCTQELKRLCLPNDDCWTIEQGSALDMKYLRTLGTFDVVYSWGVLHHTGAMWQALENAASMVKPGGKLYIAIYNDAGGCTRRWKWIKRVYNRTPCLLRPLLLSTYAAYYAVAIIAYHSLHPSLLIHRRQPERGMSLWTDLVDWIGGYPFEFAKPEEVFEYYRKRGFTLEGLRTKRGNACNEFVFTLGADPENRGTPCSVLNETVDALRISPRR